MAEISDRVRDALAAYLDYLEMGGPRPDTSHLSSTEQQELEELITALELTEGVALGLGRGDVIERKEPPSASGAGIAAPGLSDRLLARLRESLPPDVRIESDTIRLAAQIGGVSVTNGWTLGTFGGRIRVWLLAIPTAQEVESNRDCLTDLNRVFGALPDTAAVALVAEDLSCLLVRPEDCAPQINIPSGSLVGRGYSRPVQPVAEAVSEFLKELIPYWDPIPAFDRDMGLSIDPSAVGKEFVTTAIENQRAIGQRARKGNPKKEALLALGDKEITALTKLTDGLFDGSFQPEEVEQAIERLAEDR